MKFNNVEVVPGGISLKLYRSLEKALKLPVRKFWGLISVFGEAFFSIFLLILHVVLMGTESSPTLEMLMTGLHSQRNLKICDL